MAPLDEQDALCIAPTPIDEPAEPSALLVVYPGTIQAHDLTLNAEELQRELAKLEPRYRVKCETTTNQFGGIVAVYGINLSGTEGVEIVSKLVKTLHKGIASAQVQHIGLNGQNGGIVYSMITLTLELGTADVPPLGHYFAGVADWDVSTPLPKLKLMLEVHTGDHTDIERTVEDVCAGLHVELHHPVTYSTRVMSPLKYVLSL